MSDTGVLHIVNQLAGGTMRYVETLIHSVDMDKRSFVWYVGAHQHILFDVSTPYYYAFSTELSPQEQKQLILTVMKQAHIRFLGIHLHSVSGKALSVACDWLNFPITITFHDHHFLSEAPFVQGKLIYDESHINRVKEVVKDASIIVPSQYLYDQAKQFFPQSQLHVIAHDSDPSVSQLSDETISFIEQLKTQSQWSSDKFTVATIGAIGEDKGLAYMKEWDAQKGDIQFLCIGYTADVAADQNRPHAEKNTITHGFYHHSEVTELLKIYHVNVVVFFPGIAESFCYALSDIEQTVPVLAPDYGALGQRVINGQMGNVYSPATTLPKELNQLLIETAKLTPNPDNKIPPSKHMTLETAHYYQQQEIDAVLNKTLSPDELSQLLSEQLHGDNLKWELAILVRQNHVLRKEQKQIQGYLKNVETQYQTLMANQQDAEAAIKEIEAMKQTLSWKVTRPLRALRRIIK